MVTTLVLPESHTCTTSPVRTAGTAANMNIRLGREVLGG
jgi:hypothetical protein